MKSRTSFFNKTALKKDLTRYAPIWGSYTIFLLLVLFGMTPEHDAYMLDNILSSLNGMVVVNLIYAGICAAFLFMDLFNGRLCNALHAFPLRRESWLVTHIISGVLFSLVPNLLVTLVGSIMLWEYAYAVLLWLAVSTLQFLFFYGTAILCAVCAGNLIGMAANYGIFHFITLLVYGVVELLYQPLLPSVHISNTHFLHFFPLYKLCDFQYVLYEITQPAYDPLVEYQGLNAEAWLYLGLCTVAGIVSMILAWRVYRKRQLESAGDLISLKQLRPLFLLICTIGAGVLLYLFSEVFGDKSYVFLFIGMAIGYVAANMLLSRTLRVVNKRSLIRFGVLVIALAGSMCLTWLDPAGITRYVPSLDSISSASVIGADQSYYYLAEHSSLNYIGRPDRTYYQITDSAELADLQDFHRQLITYRPSENDGTLCDVIVKYELKSGRTVIRYYEVGRSNPLGERAGKYFNDMRYIFKVNDTAALYDAFQSVSINFYNNGNNSSLKLTSPEDITGLLDAIAADCKAGTMAQNWAYHEDPSKDGLKGSFECYMEFTVKDWGHYQEALNASRFHLQVYSDSENTFKYITQMLLKYYTED